LGLPPQLPKNSSKDKKEFGEEENEIKSEI
jgi:hypothetical protein